jgi:hypothetical protein
MANDKSMDEPLEPLKLACSICGNDIGDSTVKEYDDILECTLPFCSDACLKRWHKAIGL